MYVKGAWYAIICFMLRLPEVNETIGSYRILRLLGEGGMGAVYEVEHLGLGVRYALKAYVLDDEHADLFRKRFAAEGRLLARLNHPNLVRVIDLAFDETAGLLYYVMDLVLYKDGYAHTLDDLEPGGADEDQICDWFTQLCSALAYIHAQGIVHRDIKLNNILLAPDKHVVLSDFGISRVFGEKMRSEIGTTRTMVSGATGNLIVGPQGYMAPEVEAGEPATPAADVYALGVVFFKLLTGVWYDKDLEPDATRPATGITSAAKLLADFERPWRDVLPAMLATDPAKRPTDLHLLPERLAPGAAASPCRCGVSPHHKRGRQLPYSRGGETPPLRHNRLVLSALALLAIIIAAVTAFLLLKPSAPAANDDRLLEEAYSIPESVS